MFRSRTRSVWGHAAIFAWRDLILDRSRKLVGLQSPTACATRVGGDSDPNFENYDLFHAQSPDTWCGVHARSWRAYRDVDVRCLLFGWSLRVHLLALFLNGPVLADTVFFFFLHRNHNKSPIGPTGERKSESECE